MQAHKQQWHSRKSRSTSAIAHTLRSQTHVTARTSEQLELITQLNRGLC